MATVQSRGKSILFWPTEIFFLLLQHNLPVLIDIFWCLKLTLCGWSSTHNLNKIQISYYGLNYCNAKIRKKPVRLFPCLDSWFLYSRQTALGVFPTCKAHFLGFSTYCSLCLAHSLLRSYMADSITSFGVLINVIHFLSLKSVVHLPTHIYWCFQLPY